ncbi:hypothetical protein HanRHA438_Chr17g0816581 [Helianthus annuus]|nr:hypothetical protein HanRHA438_Chr17g0816581 [Helianthus annuus]
MRRNPKSFITINLFLSSFKVILHLPFIVSVSSSGLTLLISLSVIIPSSSCVLAPLDFLQGKVVTLLSNPNSQFCLNHPQSKSYNHQILQR